VDAGSPDLDYAWAKLEAPGESCRARSASDIRRSALRREGVMRRHSIFVVIAGSLFVPSYGPAELNCGADDVQATLDSMLRERVIQVVADSMPPPSRGVGRSSLRAGTRVSIHAPRLIEWDAVEGRLKCSAEVDVEAPGGFHAPAPAKRTEIRYRVMSNNPDTFLVEIAYADLMNAFTPQAPVTR
jgi:hypothetical protein